MIKKFNELNENKFTESDHINTINTYLDEIKNNLNKLNGDVDILMQVEYDLSNIIHKYGVKD